MKKWNELSMRDRAKYIRLGVQNGITNVSDISNIYDNDYNTQISNTYEEGGKKDTKDSDDLKWHKALYNAIDPVGNYPDNIFDALGLGIDVLKKYFGDIDSNYRKSYGNRSIDLAEAAWAKYNGLPYDESLLIEGPADPRGGWDVTYRLPEDIEREIPVDTNFIKERIKLNSELAKKNPYYSENVNNALRADKETLEALRKTYTTGQPVAINENSYNSRHWGVSSKHLPISPLNVLKEFNIRYSPEENKMYYSDTYDFDNDDSFMSSIVGGYDNFLKGNPFRIRGAIDLSEY